MSILSDGEREGEREREREPPCMRERPSFGEVKRGRERERVFSMN